MNKPNEQATTREVIANQRHEYRQRAEVAEKQVADLLAFLLGDGEAYQKKYGTEQAIETAKMKIDTLRDQLWNCQNLYHRGVPRK